MIEAKSVLSLSLIKVNIPKTFEARFWTHVDKNGPIHPYDESLGQCWPWIGGMYWGGYGSIRFNGRTYNASRIACMTQYGDIGRCCALHSCDRPACCNPDHLYPGTYSENLIEARDRGRLISKKGEKNNHAKLTDDLVREIRADFRSGMTRYALSEKYGICYHTVIRVIKRKAWSHVEDANLAVSIAVS